MFKERKSNAVNVWLMWCSILAEGLMFKSNLFSFLGFFFSLHFLEDMEGITTQTIEERNLSKKGRLDSVLLWLLCIVQVTPEPNGLKPWFYGETLVSHHLLLVCTEKSPLSLLWYCQKHNLNLIIQKSNWGTFLKNWQVFFRNAIVMDMRVKSVLGKRLDGWEIEFLSVG